MESSLIRPSPEVADALAEGAPVVALESSVIAHGLPHPENLRIAAEVEAAVRKAGAVPAMTAVVDGRVLAGLDDAVRERLATERAAKTGNRDVGMALARGGLGATTAAAAIMIAGRAGIPVVATGGIGGVHRDAPETYDVSGDLPQLARTPVAVACGGAKIILALDWTLEYLETAGVPVIGYRCSAFPAHYCRDGGVPVPWRSDDVAEIAAAIRLHRELDDSTGVLVATPLDEADALDGAEMERVVRDALAAAKAEGVRGQDLTPCLGRAVAAATAGRSAAANRAVLLGSAALAGELAAALRAGG